MTNPTDEQRQRALAQSEELTAFVLAEVPNTATALLVATGLIFAVERVMGQELTQSTLAEALRIARATSKG